LLKRWSVFKSILFILASSTIAWAVIVNAFLYLWRR